MTGAAVGLLAPTLDAASAASQSTAAAAAIIPEDLGADAASLLLTEVARGGCIDTSCQPLVLTLMALGPEDVSRLRIGQLGGAGVETLRLLKEFFGITFKLTPEARDPVEIAKGAAAAAAAADAADGGGDDGDDDAVAKEGGSGAGKRKRGGGKATSAVPAIAVPAPTAEISGGRSARSVLVSCLGIGYKNLAKKVT
jgi:hypothetical protein